MKRRINRKFSHNIHFSIVSVSCIVLLFLVLTMSFGFSSYSTSFAMRDLNAIVRYDQNVRVTGVSAGSASSGGTIESVDYNISNIVADIRMNQANSSVTFSVDVKNYGNVEMGIESITLPSQYQNVFDISVSGYTVGDKIRDNSDACEGTANGCTLNIQRTFNITLTYKAGAYDSNQYRFQNVILQMVFKEMHTVTFTGFTILHPPIQAKCVMDGHTYSYNIGPYDQLAVKIGGVYSNNYTIDSNNVISIPNVQDDIEIIISEILFNFDITIAPNAAQSGDTIKYVLNGGSEVTVTGNGIHLTVPYGSSLTINSIESYGYRTKTNISYNNISANVNDTITMDQVFYLDVSSDVSGTLLNYTINGVAQTAVTDHLVGEFDPNTVIVVTPSRTNYRPEHQTYTYTMNQHQLNKTINMILQCTYKAISSVPSAQSFSLSVNGTPRSINAGQDYIFDEGTTVQLTASAPGFRTKTLELHTLQGDLTETVTLTKTYVYTVNAITPSNATLALTVNGVSRGNVASGYSEVVDVNSEITLIASATGFQSHTYDHTGDRKIIADTTDDVKLLHIYSFHLTMSTPSSAKVTVNGVLQNNGNSVSSVDLTFVEGTSVKYSISADYYTTYNVSSFTMNGNYSATITMSENPSQTAIHNNSYSGITNALSGSTYSRDKTLSNVLTNCSAGCKIKHFKVSGNIDNGTQNVENGTFRISTDLGGELAYKNFGFKSRGKRDISETRDWSIPSAPTCDGSVVIHFEKGGWLTVTTPNISIDEITYVNK